MFGGSYFWAIGYTTLSQTGLIYITKTSPSAAFSPQPSSGYHIFSFIDNGAPGGDIAQYDYNTASDLTGGGGSLSYQKIGYYTMNNGVASAYWIRERAYPPNGVMPSSSLGSLVT